MPDYKADPDIRSITEDGRFVIPSDLDEVEAERLHRFLTCDQVLETFYRQNPPTVRPPEGDLRAAAETAMVVYDQRSERLSVGWQKFAVLQAGIAASPDNLDSSKIQDWAYTRIKEDNPDWLGGFDDDIDRGMPLRWLTQLIGVGVLNRRRLMEEPAPPPKKKRWFGSSTEARPGLLPPDIAAQIEERGRTRIVGFKTQETAAQEQHFLSLTQDEKQAYVDALAEELLPIGGWPVHGAADLLVQAIFEPDDYPAYVKLVLASLEFKRAARVADDALSTYETMFWRKHKPSTEWLEPKEVPARPDALIPSLSIGEEREVGRHTSAPDSNLVFVQRTAEDTYLAVVDQPIEREKDPRRVRTPMFEADNIYDVYVFLGQTPFPNFWNESELEPFCIYGRPH